MILLIKDFNSKVNPDPLWSLGNIGALMMLYDRIFIQCIIQLLHTALST